MRRSFLHAALASLVLLAFLGCAQGDSPTGVIPSARSNALIPLPPRPPLPDPNDFVQITAGQNHTCARKNNNTVYCWGVDDRGQIGMTARKRCSSGLLCVDRPTVLPVTTPEGNPGTLTATTIDAGSDHTCIIDTLNDAYCWGDGNQGQVGFAFGSYGPIFQATKVFGGVKFNLIAAGFQSTCASGSTGVFCWGDGIVSRAATPVQLSAFNGLTTLTVGSVHACGIIGASGNQAVFCWGANPEGQFGRDPATMPGSGFATPGVFATGVTRVITERRITCAEAPGVLQCAGDNTWGQLGNGTIGTHVGTFPFDWMPTVVSSTLHGVSTGTVHTCALDAGNAAYCWGNGLNGQVGTDTLIYTHPQLVPGGHTYRAIAAGGQHTCAIGTDNHIYCWGRNNNGQLGTQYFGSWVTTPVQALDP